MTVQSCEVDHSQFLVNLESFSEEEVVPCEYDLHLREPDQRWVKGLVCRTCQYCPAVQSDSQVWRPLTEILETKSKLNGWRLAATDRERWLQTVLNNVVYYLNEPPDYQQNQTDYALPSAEDKVLLCWVDGAPVGFCTLKSRGGAVPGTGGIQKYSLDIIDSVFIRKAHRGKGLAEALIDHLMRIYPSNLGFSSPISTGMRAVLLKYLSRHAEKRDNFWLCSDHGQRGDKTNIWFNQK